MLQELNESQEEKVKGELGKNSGVLPKDESGKAPWGKTSSLPGSLLVWLPSFGVGWKEGLAVKSGC